MSRRVEIFAAGCPLCDETVNMVQDLSCKDCDVTVYDLQSGNKKNLDKIYGKKKFNGKIWSKKSKRKHSRKSRSHRWDEHERNLDKIWGR